MAANFYLCLGGNQGDKTQLFTDALSLIEENVGCITQSSSIFETEAWGFNTDDLFWNQVIVVNCDKQPHAVLKIVLDIEKQLGRVRAGQGYASRPMDIDILLIDNEIINTADLTVPHPLMQQRRFVLEPLTEIAPNTIHPVLNKTTAQLLTLCDDVCQVTKKTTETKK